MNYVRNTFFSLALLLLTSAAFAADTATGGDSEKQKLTAPDTKAVAATDAGGVKEGWGAYLKAMPGKAVAWADNNRWKTGALAATGVTALTVGLVRKYNKSAKEKMDNAYAASSKWLGEQWTAYKASKAAKWTTAAVGTVGVAVLAYAKWDKVKDAGNWTADNTYRRLSWFAPKANA